MSTEYMSMPGVVCAGTCGFRQGGAGISRQLVALCLSTLTGSGEGGRAKVDLWWGESADKSRLAPPGDVTLAA